MDKKKEIKFNLNNFLLAMSTVLDFVVKDRYKISLGHSKRIAFISLNIGIKMELSEEELSDLCSYALASSIGLNQSVDDMSFCLITNQSVNNFPFLTIKNDILKYQKEKIDGSGIFALKGDEIPLFSQIIFLAKTLDLMYDFGKDNIKNRIDAIIFAKDKLDIYFSRTILEKFFECTKEISFWQDMLNEQDCLIYIYANLQDFTKILTFEDLLKITTVFSKVENPKSNLIELCSLMSDFYQFEHKDKLTFMISASLCNIGKLVLGKELLAKVDELDVYEIERIKTFPYYTKKVLLNIMGFTDIASWAMKVQERLDGKGYSFGLSAKDLNFKDRLLQCLNAYDAIRQERIYREAFSHDEAVEILKYESSENRFEMSIVEIIDDILKES